MGSASPRYLMFTSSQEPQTLGAILVCFLSDSVLRLMKSTRLAALRAPDLFICVHGTCLSHQQYSSLCTCKNQHGAKARLLYPLHFSWKKAISQHSGVQGQVLWASYTSYPLPLPPTHTQAHTHRQTFTLTKSLIGFHELVPGYCTEETHFLGKHLVNISHVYSLVPNSNG